MKLRRRIGSVFLAFAMALSLIPSVAVSALAADDIPERYRFLEPSELKEASVEKAGYSLDDVRSTSISITEIVAFDIYGTQTHSDVVPGLLVNQYYSIGSERLHDAGGKLLPDELNRIRVQVKFCVGTADWHTEYVFFDISEFDKVGSGEASPGVDYVSYQLNDTTTSTDGHKVTFMYQPVGNWEVYDIVYVPDGEQIGNRMPPDPDYGTQDFVSWQTNTDGSGDTLTATTVINQPWTVYGTKISAGGGTAYHVMRDSDSGRYNALQDELADLFNAQNGTTYAKGDVQIETIQVNGKDNEHTNPIYRTNGWNDGSSYYYIYNANAYAADSTPQNKNTRIPVNEVTGITVTGTIGTQSFTLTIPEDEFSLKEISNTTTADTIIEIRVLEKLDGIKKEIVKNEADVPEGVEGITLPSADNKVVIPEGGSVTLLYKITVTGDEKAQYIVTDDGAAWISGDQLSGTINIDGEAVIYVTKTFTGADNGKLTNSATLRNDETTLPPDDGDAEDEAEVEVEDETPAEEETYTVYTYVEFVGSGDNGALTESDETYIEETYNIDAETLDDGKYLPLGSFAAPLPDPEDEEYKPTSDTENGQNVFDTAIWEKVKLYLNEETFDWVKDAYKDVFDLSDLGWYQLCVANGALTIDSDVDGLCWHLDGKINVNVPNISVDKALTSIQRDGETLSGTDITEGMTLEVGDELTWTITVTNSGNAEATGLTLSDTLTADGETRELTSLTKDGDDTWTAGSTFSVSAGDDATFTATYTVQDTDKGLTLKNTATVSDGDDDTEDPSGETDNPVAGRKVEITKELTKVGTEAYQDGDMVEVGDVLTYTITVENTGNVALENVVVTDTLTVGGETATDVELSCDTEGVTIGEDKATATITKLEVNGEVTITATYTVPEDAVGKTISNTATVSGDDIDDGDGGKEDVTVANPAVKVEKELTGANRPNDSNFTYDKDTYKAQVGDVLSYTITVTNEGNTELTDVKVTDSLWNTGYDIKVNGAENHAGADGFTIKDEIAVDGSVTITYTYTVQDSDVAAGEITNTAGVYLDDGDTPDPSDEPDGKDDVTVEMDDYTIDITPANITIYTGGTGYAGVLENENGELVSNATASGLPEPGYHIDLPDAVEKWLTEHNVDMSVAANLAQYLHFRYYDEDGAMTRNWDLEDQGIYSMDGDTITAYVYSLSANTVKGEFKDTPVRLKFTDNGKIVTDDIIEMDENTTSATYQMTIYDGGLDQSQIKAVFTVGEGEDAETITCNVTIGTGNLTVKSVADENPDTNAIAANGDAVADGTLAAVDNDTVDYYVNDSEVKIENDADRVQLLVDSVSNNDSFNNTMAQDAISEVVAKHGNLSDAQTDMAYLDLVDTKNGNAVVTMGDDDQLTIYWPMPDDADPDGEFYIVHYADMNRTDTGMQTTAPGVKEASVTQDGNHLTFTTDSFSPFVLVYEQKDSGGPVTPPVEDDDDDTPPSVNPNPPQLNTEDHYAYIVGYEDGTVRPEGDITRAEVATIFFRLLTDESRDEFWSQTNDYTDVDADAWYNNAVSTLSNAGILNGYEDGTFQPDGNITRAEFATIAARFFEATYEGEDLFPDIEGHWAADYINQAAHAGIVNGYEDGTFRPQENITRAEAMTIVNRTLDRHPDADHFLADMKTWPDNPKTAWYYEQVQEATNSHEYVMKTDADKNPYEIWKEILPVRDWSDLENTWSEAHAG